LKDTALHCAAKNDHFPIVEFLVKNGACLYSKNRNSKTPLEVSSNNKSKKTTEFLQNLNIIIEKQYNACKQGDIESFVLSRNFVTHMSYYNQDGLTFIHSAALNGQIEMVKYLIQNGAGINIKSLDGQTPMCYACKEGHLAIVEYLANQGADLNVKDTIGNRPICIAGKLGYIDIVEFLIQEGADISDGIEKTSYLHWASKHNYLSLIQTLIENGVSINSIDKCGQTPLFVAATNSHIDQILYLIKKGSDVGGLIDGASYLHWAAKNGHVKIVQALVDKGLDVDIKDVYQNTPLYVAATNNCIEVVAYLIKQGSEIHNPLNETSYLHWAAKMGFIKIVQALVEKGFDVDTIDTHNQTPLYLASKNSQIEVVLYLIKHGSDFNIQIDNLSYFHWAIKHGYHSIVELLVERGVNINLKDEYNRTPLYIASNNNFPDIFLYLAKLGCDLITPIESMSYIHWASLKGYFQIVEFLIKQGFNIDLLNKDGDSPLHLAVQYSRINVVKCLVIYKANINQRNSYEETPLHIAADKGMLSFVEFLVENGAIINVIDQIQNTPIHLASIGGFNYVVQYLISKGANCNLTDFRFLILNI